jgi:hypothetical protein
VTSAQGANQPANSASDGTYLYVANSGNGTVSKVLLSDPTTYVSAFITTGYAANELYGISVQNGYVYTAGKHYVIAKWNANDGSLVSSSWASVGSQYNNYEIILAVDQTYLYALVNGHIHRFQISDAVKNPSGAYLIGINSKAMCLYGSYLYTSTTGHNIVTFYLVDNYLTVIANDASLNIGYGLVCNGETIYTTNQAGNAIDKVNAVTGAVTLNFISSGLNSPRGLTLLNTENAFLYVSNYGNSQISKMSVPSTFNDNLNWFDDIYGQSWFVANDGTYLYLTHTGNNVITKILISDPAVFSVVDVGNRSYGIYTDGTHLYVQRSGTGGVSAYIAKYTLDLTVVNLQWAVIETDPGPNLGSRFNINSDGTYLYVGYGDYIYRFNLSDGTRTPSGPWLTGIRPSSPFCITGGFMYACVFGTGNNVHFAKIHMVTKAVTRLYQMPDYTTHTQAPVGMATDGKYIYTSNLTYISKYNIRKNTLNALYKTIPNYELTLGITLYTDTNNNKSLFSAAYIKHIMKLYIVPDYPCFKRDTKILTNQGYIPVQSLRKGHLVKTLNDGYVPVYMLGKSKITHLASEERVKNQLYKYAKDAYPEITEDLVLTGCHSILVKKFKDEEERAATIETNGHIYFTDKMYRLPACVDKRAKVYETPGEYDIYHLALENEDYYMNYGIYANGLLVESCSKRYLKELSNMKIVSK